MYLRLFAYNLCIVTVAASAASTPFTPNVWYVSPNGSDSANGKTPTTAFGTLERARNAIRRTRAHASTPQKTSPHTSQNAPPNASAAAAEVRLLPGTYWRNATLVLEAQDGNVHWTVWPPNPRHDTPRAVVSFGVPVHGPGWSRDGHNPNVWRRTVPGVAAGEFHPRELFNPNPNSNLNFPKP